MYEFNVNYLLLFLGLFVVVLKLICGGFVMVVLFVIEKFGFFL